MFGKTNKSPNEMSGQTETIVGLGATDSASRTAVAPAAGIGTASQTADVRSRQGGPVNGTASGGAARSIIGADLKVIGDLHCEGDLQIDGTVEGDINSRSLTVGEGAHIEGSICAETARIWGFASGQVKATSVVIAKTAKVIGDIAYQTLAIEEGAVLDGQCRQIASANKTSAKTDISALKAAQSGKAAKGKPNGGAQSDSDGGNPVAA